MSIPRLIPTYKELRFQLANLYLGVDLRQSRWSRGEAHGAIEETRYP
jgi:hypothetical protein